MIRRETAAPPPTLRRLDLDNLRNIAVLLLIVFHTARLFDSEAWHIKDSGRYAWADGIVRLLNQWQMPLLFLLAGMAAWHALERNGVAAFLRERVMRLFVPLVAGIFIAVYPQVYVERIAAGAPGRTSPIDFAGGPLDFLPRFFDCCYPQANFSYHHLWFIWYLLAYSMVLAPLFVLSRRPPARGILAASAEGVDSAARLMLLGVPLVAIEILLRPAYPSTHAFADDWANHAHFLFLVFLGWWLARSPRTAAALAAGWRGFFAAALGLTVLWTVRADALPGALLGRGLRHAGEWFWLLALLGLARRHLDRPIPALSAFTRYAFTFYIVHQAVIVILGWWWLGWASSPVLKFAAIAAAGLAGSLLFCRLVDTHPLLRFLFGLKPRRAA